MPWIFTAAVLATALARRTMFLAWLRGFLSTSHTSRVPRSARRPRSSSEMQDSILGRRRAEVIAALGAPPVVSFSPIRITTRRESGPGGFWRARWWYYALRSDATLAIQFVDGIARQIDLVELPAISQK